MNIVNGYIEQAKFMVKVSPHLRYGQALFNLLPSNLAEEIKGTDLDPSYDDSIVEDFLSWLSLTLPPKNLLSDRQ